MFFKGNFLFLGKIVNFLGKKEDFLLQLNVFYFENVNVSSKTGKRKCSVPTEKTENFLVQFLQLIFMRKLIFMRPSLSVWLGGLSDRAFIPVIENINKFES